MFLSGAVSQNASYADSINLALPGGQMPRKFGTLGLAIPQGAKGTISVQFEAMAAVRIAGPNVGNLVLRIVRGPAFAGHLVYTAIQSYEVFPGDQFVVNLSATAADYDVPVPPSNFLEYSAFISSDVAGTRIGPENFEAFAFNVIA